ncbi:MAG: ABC transporter permease [Rhodospirillales bacterium]|jgi:peptide/nickel transport system permease protein|nr:ABC transporter permease [Rhodospirillales bacterium]
MGRFLLTRASQALFTLWVVVSLVFLLIHATGDPIAVLAPQQMNAHERAILRAALGLNQPLAVQYVRYLAGVLHGNLGVSYYSGQPAMRLILERVPVTLELVGLSIGIAVVLGVPFGIWAAVRSDRLADRLLRSLSVLGSSVPTFFLGILLIYVFSVAFNILPASGAGGLRHYVMPACTLAFFRIALFTRLVRSTLLETLSQNHVRTARAKGVSEPVVILKHALRTALLPLVTVFGLQFGQLFAGAVITETIFALPGMNRMALQALYRLDFPIILAYVLVVAAMFVTINFLVDVAYGVLDPRVRRHG